MPITNEVLDQILKDYEVLIPFTQNFDGREDLRLEEKLIQSELSGILNWALEGLRSGKMKVLTENRKP